jgi:rhamnogalacturonyl hydrolase YesR
MSVISNIFSLIVLSTLMLTSYKAIQQNDDLARAKNTLQKILIFYDARRDKLFNETYPVKPDNKVSYIANDDTVTRERVAYLWPTSGVLSGTTALLETTGNNKYLRLIENRLLPGLDNYFDTLRKPFCYQSYITLANKSDRYYDDNVWLALDFCRLYSITHNHYYLEKAITLWSFIISGWDNKLGGGIYWCEQKKQSKNTCSNAPASVLALMLFEATMDSSYFNWGLRIYNWTKLNLQDSTDHLYFDNITIAGRIDKRKYTYNSGQMMDAAAKLYNLTGNHLYLDEAQHIAESAIDHFTEEFTTPDGKKIRLFKNTGNWFNAILLRGYAQLYRIDRNDKYIKIFSDNMDQLWNHVRDKNGLFSKDWKGLKDDQYKWLLDQAGLVEIWATLYETDSLRQSP